MSIHFDDKAQTLTLHTANTTYQMLVDTWGHLLHLYYGRRLEGYSLERLYPPTDRGFSLDYYETRCRRGTASPDTQPQ